MKLILDFDQQVYASGFATEGEPISHTLHTVKTAIDRQLKETGCTEYQIYIGGTGNFRDDISPAYKATRSARKPAAYDEIREYLITRYNAEVVNGIETDDKVSMLLWEDFVTTGGRKEKATLILSSPDKDLLNTPGWHYFPKTGQLQWITDTQARRHFLYQLLMGDRVDNVTGLPQVDKGYAFRMGLGNPPRNGCGKVWAKKIMDLNPDVVESEINVYRAYLAMGAGAGWSESQTRNYLEDQGRLLWMLREVDPYGEPVMWNVSEEMWNVARRREAESSGSDRLSEEEGGTEARGAITGGEGGVDEKRSNQEHDGIPKSGLPNDLGDDAAGWINRQHSAGFSGDPSSTVDGIEVSNGVRMGDA